MIERVITMTIEIKTTTADDISVVNEVLNFNCSHLPKEKIFSGASWVVPLAVSADALLLVTQFVFELIKQKLSGYTVWLLVGTATWQPDTRIVRHTKLWNSLKSRGVEISHVSSLQEVTVEGGGKVKFFGAAKLSDLSIPSVVKILLEERCTYISAVPDPIAIQGLLELGWSGDFDDDFELINYLGRNDGLIFKKLGEFDDLERGLAVVGTSMVVNELMK